MITIKDIAKAAGVSYATVSRALNRRSDVNLETQARIIALAEEMGYQPNMIARNLVNQRSNTISLIVPDVSNPYFADLARAVSNAANMAGYTTIISNTGWDPEREQAMLAATQEQRVAGVIIKPTSFYKPGTLSRVGLPLLVFWHPTTEDANYIEIDHRKGATIAVQHLIDRGFRHIAYLGGLGTSPANQLRLLSYQQTLQQNGITVNPDIIRYGGFEPENAYESIKQMMQHNPKIDAVFCGNDYLALGVMQYAQENGLRYPNDFGIVGYDDMYFAALPLINLTTIRQPREDLGRKAFEILQVAIEKPESKTVNVLVEPQLIIRGT